MKTKWYQDWFNKDYLSLYAHRNQLEAKKQIDFLFDKNIINSYSTVLDSACGAGRHLHALAHRVKKAYGLDLSSDLLEEAKTILAPFSSNIELFRGDMREVPLADNSVDTVLSMFTSFGYFNSDKEHIALLKEWHRVLSNKGTLVIDYLNKPQVVSNLKEFSSEEINGLTVSQYRSISNEQLRVEKRIVLTDFSQKKSKEYMESVRMYSRSEMEKLLHCANFHITHIFGDFKGNRYSETSPHLIIIAKTKNVSNEK